MPLLSTLKSFLVGIGSSERINEPSSIAHSPVRLRNNQRNASNIETGDLESEIESCREASPQRSRISIPAVQHQTRSEFVLPMCEFDTTAIGGDRYDEFENLDEFHQIPPIMSQSSYGDLGGGYANHRRASFGFAPIENQNVYQQPHPATARKMSNRVTSFEASGVSSNEEATTSSVENHNQPVRVKVRPTKPMMARSMSSIAPSRHRNYHGASTPGLNNIGEPSPADVMSHTETSNSAVTTPNSHFPQMRNSPSFQQLRRQQMKLNLGTPTTPVVEHNPQPQPYTTSSRRSSTIFDYGHPETPSEMNTSVFTNHNHIMPTSTPNKIAVAPLQKPRRSEREEREREHSNKSHHHRGYDKRVMPLRSPYQCNNSPSSSGSSARSPSVGARVGSPLSKPVPIDLYPSISTPSNQELADRVRFLEQCIATGGVSTPASDMHSATSLMFAANSGHSVTPTSRIHRTAQLVVSTTPTMSLNQYNLAQQQQQIMARDVVEKDYLIENLRKQIEQLHKQMETRQIQYDEDVNSFKKESEEARSQLLTLKSKIGDLENESKVYQDKSARLDQTRQVAIVESQEKLLAQEKELSALRQELAKKEQLSNDYEQMKTERDWFDKQNESLSQQLDETDAIKKRNEMLTQRLQEKDAQVKELEDTILAMEIKANMNLSNSSNGGFFYDEDDDDISIDHLLPSGSATPVSASNFDLSGMHRVSKSASTHQIGSEPSNRVISTQMAQMFMGLLRKSNQCKVIARCLCETAGNIADGKEPNFNRLLGCYSDVSESDSEPMITGSASNPTNMTTAVAERYLRKNNEDLARVEHQLNELRSKFVAFYQQKCEAKQCKIQ